MIRKIDKKTLVFSVTMITFLTLFIIFWIVQNNEKNNICIISVKNEKNEDAKGSEVRISQIYIGRKNIDLGKVAIEEGFLYENGQIVIYPYDTEKIFTLYSERLENINISFIMHSYSGYVHIENIDGEEYIDLYSSTDSTYEYCLTFSLLNALKTYFSSLGWIFLWILIYIIMISITYILIKKCLPMINKLELWHYYKKLKKIPIILLSLVFSLAVVVDIMFVFIDQDEEMEYVIQVNNERNEKAKGSEVRITSIKIGGILQELDDLAKKNGFVYDKGYLIIYPYDGEKKVSIKAPVLSSVEINFLQHEWSGIVHIFGREENIIDLYSDKSQVKSIELAVDTFSILKQYINKNWKSQIGVYFQIIVISFLISYFLICNILYTYYKMTRNRIKIRNIVIFVTSVFILDFITVFLCIEISGKLTFIIEIFKLLISTIYLKKNKKKFLENSYLSIAVLAGCFIMIVLPPGHVPDEMSHFTKSCIMAGENLAEKIDEKSVYLQKDIYDFFYKYTKNIHSLGYTVSATSYFEDVGNRLDLEQDKVFYGGYTTDGLKELPYIPSAIILWIAQYIGGVPIFIFYSCRFIDFLIALILIFYAIRVIPIFKRILLIIALFPITLQQMGAINQDWITNAMCILLIALILREITQKNQIQNKNIFVIMGVGIILAYCKLAYYFLLLLAILIPKERFKNRKAEVVLKVSMICPGLFLALLITFAYKGDSLANSALLGTRYSLTYLIHYPIRSFQVYWNTFNERAVLDLLGGLQTGFGWSIKWSDGIIRFILQILTIFMIVLNNEKIEKNYFVMKIMLGFVFMLEIGVIYSAAFTWTSIESDMIGGLQSRYFIPVTLIAYMLFNNPKLTFASKHKNCVYVYISLVTIVIGMSTIIFGYYV